MHIIPFPASIAAKRIIGLTPYAFGLISCAVAGTRGREVSHRTRLVAVLVVLEAALLLDMVFSVRLLLHNLLAGIATANKLYFMRAGPQQVALGLLGIAVMVGIGLAFRLFRGRPGACLAACGSILSLCFWWVEVISLHAVDSLLYHRVNGVMLVRMAWAACSLMMGVGILWDVR